ncbi:MAG: phosphate ABC transporter ATP-binding protein [Betaproteobacteria bacterium]|nr:phosphate ABC transporter ATP-binding protein [Betaproteobacteria bacterium]
MNHREPGTLAGEDRVLSLGSEPLLSLRQASVQFGAVRALENIDLSLHVGERLALVGANGSGKTTLLRLLHGLVPLSTGERCWVLAASHPDGSHPIAARRGLRPPTMAMVFQRPFLLNLSVRNNLRIALWLRGVGRGERGDRIRQALTRVGLTALADRPAGVLSGGQQQRLALGIAWAAQPDVLFLDEPTASLDPSAKREVEGLIDELARDGLTVVMTTHNLGQAKRLATRVIYLEAGRLVVDKPVGSFFSEALPFAAERFLQGELSWN